MTNDALEPSLSETSPSLERQVKDLQAILPHLLSSITEARDAVGVNGAKVDRCMAVAASAQARAELAIEHAREAVPVAREAALEELLKVAQAASDDGPRHAEPKRKRKCKLPPGWGGIVAGTAIALAALKAHHKAAAITGAAALLTAAAAPVTATLLPSPGGQAPPAAARAHHARAGRRDLDPLMAAPGRWRDRDTVMKSVHRERAPSPKGPAATGAASPPPSPVPSPAGSTIPVSPAATPPVPTPAPTGTGILAGAWDH